MSQTRVTIYISEELKDLIDARAMLNKRSRTAEIFHTLEMSFKATADQKRALQRQISEVGYEF